MRYHECGRNAGASSHPCERPCRGLRPPRRATGLCQRCEIVASSAIMAFPSWKADEGGFPSGSRLFLYRSRNVVSLVDTWDKPNTFMRLAPGLGASGACPTRARLGVFQRAFRYTSPLRYGVTISKQWGAPAGANAFRLHRKSGLWDASGAARELGTVSAVEGYGGDLQQVDQQCAKSSSWMRAPHSYDACDRLACMPLRGIIPAVTA